MFFLAQAISVALYVIGFTEAFQNLFPNLGLSARAIGTIVNVAIFICVYVGASWAIKVQYGILAILALALGSFFAGAIPAATEATLRANLQSSYTAGGGFFVMFALLFPAVTGIRRASICRAICKVRPSRFRAAKAREKLSRLMEAARVPATVEIVSGEDSIAAMRNCSLEAAVVLKGFTPPNEAEDLATLEEMRAEIGDLRRVIMVYSAGGHSLSA